MHILRVNVTFYDAVNIIHDVITTRNPFPYTAKFMFVGVKNNETQQIRRWKINRIRILCCRISKISNSVEKNDNFFAKARKLSILSTSLDIFDIRQHYIRILYNHLPCNSFFSRALRRKVFERIMGKVEMANIFSLFLQNFLIFKRKILSIDPYCIYNRQTLFFSFFLLFLCIDA